VGSANPGPGTTHLRQIYKATRCECLKCGTPHLELKQHMGETRSNNIGHVAVTAHAPSPVRNVCSVRSVRICRPTLGSAMDPILWSY
jgi:hypothetical protein